MKVLNFNRCINCNYRNSDDNRWKSEFTYKHPDIIGVQDGVQFTVCKRCRKTMNVAKLIYLAINVAQGKITFKEDDKHGSTRQYSRH